MLEPLKADETGAFDVYAYGRRCSGSCSVVSVGDMHGGKPFVRLQAFSLSSGPDLRELSQTERRQDVASIGTALPKIHHDLGMPANML